MTVDGKIVTEMGVRITPGQNKICFDGKVLQHKEQHHYFLVNKPKGYVTTVSDPQGRPVVTSLIKNVKARLFPVGRLDLDTEGALILTNDGALAQKIQHPSNITDKTYEVLVHGFPNRGKLESLQKGILLDGKQTAPARVKILAKKRRNCLLEMTIHEGRKHQVKKMFAHIGHPVLHLKRTAYGKLRLGNLPSGHFILLNPEDLKKIFL